MRVPDCGWSEAMRDATATFRQKTVHCAPMQGVALHFAQVALTHCEVTLKESLKRMEVVPSHKVCLTDFAN